MIDWSIYQLMIQSIIVEIENRMKANSWGQKYILFSKLCVVYFLTICTHHISSLFHPSYINKKHRNTTTIPNWHVRPTYWSDKYKQYTRTTIGEYIAIFLATPSPKWARMFGMDARMAVLPTGWWCGSRRYGNSKEVKIVVAFPICCVGKTMS